MQGVKAVKGARTRLAACSVLACALSIPVAAHAQSAPASDAAIEVAGGYSRLTELPEGPTPSTTYPRGWFISGGSAIGWPRLVWTGEVGVNARTNLAIETQRIVSFLGGAHVPLVRRGRLRAYGSALAGMERFSEPGFSESGFAFQPGGGVDIRIWQALGARVQGDYRIAWLDTGTYKDVRLLFGAVLRVSTP